MWIFNFFLWMLMGINPDIHEDEYYQLWHCAGTCAVDHPASPTR